MLGDRVIDSQCQLYLDHVGCVSSEGQGVPPSISAAHGDAGPSVGSLPCTLRLLTPHRVHHDDVYGDINLVNGVPYPRMEVQPKWYRLRLLNSGIDRPYLIKIKDAQGL